MEHAGDNGSGRMKLYDLKEAAEILHMSADTLRRKLRPRGTWPARRIGRQIMFTEQDIAAIVEMSAEPKRPAPTRSAS